MKKSIFLIFAFLFGCTTTVVEKSNDNQKPISTNSSSLDLTNDPNNCGSEGYTCVGGRSCVNSRCYPAWTQITIPGSPTPRGRASATSLNGKYIISGGCDSSETSLSDVYSYDPILGSWSALPSLTTARSQHTMVSSKNSLFVVGGLSTCFNGTTIGPELEILYPNQTSWLNSIYSGSPQRYNIGAAWNNGMLFSFGGGGFNDAYSSAEQLSLEDGWKDISCPLNGCARSGNFSMFKDNNYLRVWGGNPNLGTSAPNGLSFDMDSNKWFEWSVPNNTPDFSTVSGEEPAKYADDGVRLFYLSNNHTMMIYNKITQYWSVDIDFPPPSEMCNDSASAFAGKEVIVWSGLCNNSIQTLGYSYQPSFN